MIEPLIIFVRVRRPFFIYTPPSRLADSWMHLAAQNNRSQHLLPIWVTLGVFVGMMPSFWPSCPALRWSRTRYSKSNIVTSIPRRLWPVLVRMFLSGPLIRVSMLGRLQEQDHQSWVRLLQRLQPPPNFQPCRYLLQLHVIEKPTSTVYYVGECADARLSHRGPGTSMPFRPVSSLSDAY